MIKKKLKLMVRMAVMALLVANLSACKKSSTEKAIDICTSYTEKIKKAKTPAEFQALQKECGAALIKIEDDNKKLTPEDEKKLAAAGETLGREMMIKAEELGVVPQYDILSGATTQETSNETEDEAGDEDSEDNNTEALSNNK